MAKKEVKKPQESTYLGGGVYVLDDSKKFTLNEKKKIVYTLLGKQDKLIEGLPVLLGEKREEDDLAYAYREIANNKQVFYIKTNEIGELVNPVSQERTSSFKSKLMKDDKTYLYVKVREECFNHYLEFLKTANVLHYKFASTAAL